MKNYFRIAAAVMMITLGLAVCAFGQRIETFKDTALYSLKEKAEALTDNRVLRVTRVEETLEKGSKIPTKYSKSINEYLPPDRSRSVYETKTTDGIKRTEYIDIGKQRFVRENNGAWQIFKPSGRGGGTGSGSGNGGGESPKVESTTENKLMRGVTVNKKKTDYYESLTTIKHIYAARTEVFYRKKGYWFDAEGKYIRTLEENYDDKASNRRTVDYEYDLKIEIVAPIK